MSSQVHRNWEGGAEGNVDLREVWDMIWYDMILNTILSAWFSLCVKRKIYKIYTN